MIEGLLFGTHEPPADMPLGVTINLVEPSIETLRDRQWTIVKADRDAAEIAGASTPFGVVDSDLNSQVKISGAIETAKAVVAGGGTFSIDWTMKDNSIVTLDADEIVQMGLAVSEHVQTVHATGQGLRADIMAATTREAVEAIVWTN